jgi:hypothetical protein
VRNLASSSYCVWSAVVKDLIESESPITYIESINAAMESFIKSGEMWNSEEYMSQFVSMKENTQQLVMLTGGPSTGKSMIIDYFLKNLTGEVGIVVDGRSSQAALGIQLIKELRKSLPDFELPKNYLDNLKNEVPKLIPFFKFSKAAKSVDQIELTLVDIVKAVRAVGVKLNYLFIDEANLILETGI